VLDLGNVGAFVPADTFNTAGEPLQTVRARFDVPSAGSRFSTTFLVDSTWHPWAAPAATVIGAGGFTANAKVTQLAGTSTYYLKFDTALPAAGTYAVYFANVARMSVAA